MIHLDSGSIMKLSHEMHENEWDVFLYHCFVIYLKLLKLLCDSGEEVKLSVTLHKSSGKSSAFKM